MSLHAVEPQWEAAVPSHGHSRHSHSPEEKRAALNRLSRAIGHLEFVKRMVEQEVDCPEVLVQISAVKSALNNTGILLLKGHMEHCMVEAVKNEDFQAIDDISRAIAAYIK